jgi:hypothetical protein
MISMVHKLAAPAAAAVLALSGASANAALVSTSPSCVISILNPDYTACGGSFAGNDKNQQDDVNAYILGTFGLTTTYQGASDEAGSGPFTSSPGSATGTLTFDTAIDGPFVLSLKAGDQFSLFYYDGSGPAISSIDYSTLGVNQNAQDAGLGLSHASLYSGDVVPGIPEPQTYALMLAGLGFVGFMARRRRPQ